MLEYIDSAKNDPKNTKKLRSNKMGKVFNNTNVINKILSDDMLSKLKEVTAEQTGNDGEFLGDYCI